jgi:hypothetical protein
MTFVEIFPNDIYPDIMGMIGYLPHFISENDPRPAREQLDSHYQHGGGWRPLEGWEMVVWGKNGPRIQYPGDPPIEPLAKIELREEQIFIYPYAQVLIMQPDGSFEVARMD